ncbi:hypothetical protein [Pseudanabaena sp. 'Roaring Creek']|uniref:hypothetical protein n=1 Tax=Pseudanabaena sp. 'Roaring Creek' TaxID=1681830 RepID=UPI0006D7C5F0|nr:hypothetical protein [Pseudanabaena sp. 'Roaring Creek']
MFPNPANYYLPTPEQFETEMTSFGLLSLATINHEITYYLESVLVDEQDDFQASGTTKAFDEWIVSLKADELINLIRWITERLAYLYQKETSAKAA